MAARTSPSRSKKKQPQKLHHWIWRGHPTLWKVLGWVFGVIAVLAIGIYIAFQVSPWPKSLLIRYEFDQNSARVSKALQKHVPAGITAIENQQYRSNDRDGYLDVFYPQHASDDPLPAIIWVHGGAWVSGDKNNIDNYLKVLAGQGFTTVGVDYSIAPEHQYPTPLLQVSDALKYIQDNAQRLHIDPNRIFLAGDSAGSQIVAQMATIITSPSYSAQTGIAAPLSPGKLRGVLLNCGAYDLSLPDYNGPFGDFLHTVLWAYSGTPDFLRDPKLKTASVINYVTADFPPAFVTAGNVDPLLPQSVELAKKLQSLGVQTSTLFYAADHQPALNHEYQFDLDTADGQKALTQMVEFARQRQ